MTTSDVRKVYYHHLKKCGGTSLNRWLDAQFAYCPVDQTAIQKRAYATHMQEKNRVLKDFLHLKIYGETVLQDRDLCHDHAGLVNFVPKGTFCFTVLRNPIDRLVSQIRDNRRLSESDLQLVPPKNRPFVAAQRSMRMKPFFEQFVKPAAGHFHLFDNYMVRAIANNRTGPLSGKFPDAKALLPPAMEVLESDFDFVGMLEEMDLTQHILCASLGWMPTSELPVLNAVKRDEKEQEEISEAYELLLKMTEQDTRLFEFARTRFEQSRARYETFTTSEFENGPIKQRMSCLRSVSDGDWTEYQMDQPINATGHLGRDRNETGHCWIWTQAHIPFAIYVPVPSGARVSVRVRCVELASPDLLATLNVQLNDAPIAHRIVDGQEGQKFIEIDAQTDRQFIRITFTHKSIDGTAVQTGGRGLRLDRYGWKYIVKN